MQPWSNVMKQNKATDLVKAVEDVLAYDVAVAVAERVALLVGQEEDDAQEEQVDADLLEHGRHLHLVTGMAEILKMRCVNHKCYAVLRTLEMKI